MNNQRIDILVVDDSDVFRPAIIGAIRADFVASRTRLVFHEAVDASRARELLKKNRIDVALLDLSFPNEPGGEPVSGNGIRLFEHIAENNPTISCVGMTGNETISMERITFLDKAETTKLMTAIRETIARAQSKPDAGPGPAPK